MQVHKIPLKETRHRCLNISHNKLDIHREAAIYRAGAWETLPSLY